MSFKVFEFGLYRIESLYLKVAVIPERIDKTVEQTYQRQQRKDSNYKSNSKLFGRHGFDQNWK